MKNRVQQFRKKRGLSQRALAQAAKTSQAQVQRIEAGPESVRLDLAERIAKALDTPLADLFPDLRKTLRSLKLKVEHGQEEPVFPREQVSEALQKAGIDPDPRTHHIKFRLRGGLEGMWDVSGKDADRLFRVFQNEDPEGFVRFETGSTEIAVNPRHLLVWHFLWSPGATEPEEKAQEALRIYLAEGGEPLEFEVEPAFDSASVDDEDDADQVRDLLEMLETGGANPEIIQFAFFDDADGEEVFFRPADVSMVEVPLWAVQPREYDEDDEEDQDAADLDASDDAAPDQTTVN